VSEAAVPGLFQGKVGRDGPRLAFVFPGRAHHGMAQQLYATQPAFRRAFDSCVEWLPVDVGGRGSGFPAGSPDGAGDIDEGARIFSIEYALAALWKSWGVEPDVVVGDGPGEYVAACVAGVFTVHDGLTLLLGQRPHAGAAPGRVSADGGFATGGGQALRAPTSPPDAEPLVFAAPRIGFVCRSGRLAEDEILSAAYWCGGGVSRPLDTAAATESLSRQRVEFLVTAGSSGIGADEAPRLMDRERCLPGLGQATGDDWTALLNALAALYVRGAPISWSAFDGEYARRRLQLPTYPFQRRRYRISETGGASTGSSS
jgi:acyl transferase domain-containing protein